MSWYRASTMPKKAVTESAMAALVKHGSPLPNWYIGLSVKKPINPCESNASPLPNWRTIESAMSPGILSVISLPPHLCITYAFLYFRILSYTSSLHYKGWFDRVDSPIPNFVTIKPVYVNTRECYPFVVANTETRHL